MITGMPRIAIASSDFHSMVTFFAETMSVPVIDISESSVDSLGASLGMCVPAGGSNIELMSPATPAAPLAQSLQRFLDRHGEGLFALMLEAADPNAEADALIARGMKVLPLMPDASGRDIHPSSTHGVLIRVYPTGSFKGTMQDQGDLSGIERVIVAVSDVDQASSTWGVGLGLAADAAQTDSQRGIRSVIIRPPAGGVIELAEPVDASKPFAQALQTQLDDREGMFCLVLKGRDLPATERRLADAVIAFELGEDALTVMAFGTRIRVEG